MEIYRIASIKYVYHGTGEGAFRKIKLQGLNPPIGGFLYFSEGEQYAESYAGRKDNPFGNRVLRTIKRSHMVRDNNTKFKGDFKTTTSIPASELEVKVNGVWIPVEQYSDPAINI